MFTFDIALAKECCVNGSYDVICFTVAMDDSRRNVFLTTEDSLLHVCENIAYYKESLVNFLSEQGFEYMCLTGISYV